MFYTCWVWGDSGISKWKCPFSSWKFRYQITEMRKIVFVLHRRNRRMKIQSCHSSVLHSVKLQPLKWFLRPYLIEPPVISLISSPAPSLLSSSHTGLFHVSQHSDAPALGLCPVPLPVALFFQIAFSLPHFLQVFAHGSPSQRGLSKLPAWNCCPSRHTPKLLLLPYFSP